MVESRAVGIGVPVEPALREGALRRSAARCFQPLPRESEEDRPLLSRLRERLAAPERLRGAGPRERAEVRGDVAELVDRLERLRLAFPGRADLLARVGLSDHVLRLLGEACGPARPGPGGGRRR